jgi:hypothetical protein
MQNKTPRIAAFIVTALTLTVSYQGCGSITHDGRGSRLEKGGEGLDGKPYQIYGSCAGKVDVAEIVVVSPGKTSASLTRENCQDINPPKTLAISDLKFSFDASALEMKGKIFDQQSYGTPQRVTHSICKSNEAMPVEIMIWSDATGSTNLSGQVSRSDGATSGVLQVVTPVAQAPSRFVSVTGQTNQFDLTLDGPLSYTIGGIAASAPSMTCVSQVPVATDCTQTLAAGANLASVISSASPGAVICLNSGSYGALALNNVQKSPRIKVRSVSGNNATLSLDISNGTNGITFDSVTVTAGVIRDNTTRNITIQNSLFTGFLVVTGLANSNVLLDRNIHNNINNGTGTSPARIHLNYTGPAHSGVTVQNSLFQGGTSGGVNSGSGINILNNEIGNLTNTAIGLISAPDSVVRGNYIHNVMNGIAAYNGLTRALIENNVVNTGDNRWGIELYSDENSIVRHNTFPFVANCSFGSPCGNIYLGRDANLPAGVGTFVENNIATTISVNDGSSYSGIKNLVRSGAATADVTGSPIYSGGALPATFEGFRLTPASPGYQAGSDGLNIGAN